jgi:hypothetical protein
MLGCRAIATPRCKGEWSTELDFAMLADEWAEHRDQKLLP